jgi:NAD/NADP transhydrogenase alpha subunit
VLEERAMTAVTAIATATTLTRPAKVVAWICFFVGLALLGIGTVLGLVISFKKVSGSDAKDVKQKVAQVKNQVIALQASAKEGFGVATTDASKAAAAQATGDAANSTLDEINSIIGSLPEQLRFAGLLILLGVALMSVATVQFGGTSIF